MFKCLDKNNKQIHTDDVGKWQERPCMVTCIFTEVEVQISFLGEGLPELIHPSELEVTNSYIDKLRSLATVEELQTILLNAEARMKSEMAERKESKSKSGNPRVTKEKITEEAEEL
jgi:hypothetical protein